MGGHLAVRVVTAVFALQINAGRAERLDLGGDLRPHVALEIDELPAGAAGKAPQEGIGVRAQDTGQRRQIGPRRDQRLGVGPDGVHGRAHRQGFAVAVQDHAAVGRDGDHPQVTRLALALQELAVEHLQIQGAPDQGAQRGREGGQQQDAPVVDLVLTDPGLHGSTITMSSCSGMDIPRRSRASRSMRP